MGKRRRARELALQVLFHLEFNPDGPSEAFDLVCESFGAPESDREFARMLVLGVSDKRAELDKAIAKASRNWRIDRMTRVDRSILRIAVFEMMFVPDIPAKVSMDEAVEVGKRFGSEDSGRYINGVLDYIYNSIIKKDFEESESGEDGAQSQI